MGSWLILGELANPVGRKGKSCVTVLVLTPFWFLNEYYGLLYTKLHYIGPVESIFEGLEILEVLSEELKLPGLKGLCLEPT